MKPVIRKQLKINCQAVSRSPEISKFKQDKI